MALTTSKQFYGLGALASASVLSLFLLPSESWAQMIEPQSCELWQVLQNDGRYVWGPVNAECSGDQINCFPFYGHTVPWGNWGVDSNLMSRRNTDQFAGWVSEDGQLQWNSCTDEYPPPNPLRYNANGASDQESTGGVRTYAYMLAGRWNGVSCEGLLGLLDGLVVTSAGNYMDIWELDGCDEDEHVAFVQLPDLSAVLSCDPGGHFCQGFGSWENAAWVSPNNLTTRVRLIAEAMTVAH